MCSSDLDVLPDILFRFGSDEVYIPRNFNNRYNGPVRFRTALASSLNVPAVSLLDLIGEAFYADTLDKLHFNSIRTKGFDAGLALALGSAQVSLYELVRAFSVFPRDGTVIPLRLLENSGSSGAVLSDSVNDDFSPSRVYSPDSARIICSILSDSEVRVKGFGFSSVFKTDFPSMFKTGTANQYQSLIALCASSAYSVDAARMAVAEALAAHDVDGVAAHRIDVFDDLLLRAVAQCHHGDHRGNADDDAQHGQERAHLVGQNGLDGHPKGLAALIQLVAQQGTPPTATVAGPRGHRRLLAVTLVGNNAAVKNLHHPVGVGGHPMIMGDNDNAH